MKVSAKRFVPILLVLGIVWLALPVWGSDMSKDEETIRNADTVLRAMVGSKDIPASVVAKADCIVILPSVKKFAVGIGGTGGRGPMTCREGADFSGKWGPPAMYSIGGASAGLQIGGTAKDYVVLVMTSTAANKLLDGKVKVGSDATAAAGSGASASTSTTDMLTYSRTSGLFAGVSLDGASLNPDSDANQRLYGKAVSARDIVGGQVKATPAGQSLVSLLDSKAGKK
ncbi:MAG: lipid-binding SYLF domain-containing protein [Candidatus Korobacteraceae bacterium]